MVMVLYAFAICICNLVAGPVWPPRSHNLGVISLCWTDARGQSWCSAQHIGPSVAPNLMFTCTPPTSMPVSGTNQVCAMRTPLPHVDARSCFSYLCRNVFLPRYMVRPASALLPRETGFMQPGNVGPSSVVVLCAEHAPRRQPVLMVCAGSEHPARKGEPEARAAAGRFCRQAVSSPLEAHTDMTGRTSETAENNLPGLVPGGPARWPDDRVGQGLVDIAEPGCLAGCIAQISFSPVASAILHHARGI